MLALTHHDSERLLDNHPILAGRLGCILAVAQRRVEGRNQQVVRGGVYGVADCVETLWQSVQQICRRQREESSAVRSAWLLLGQFMVSVMIS